MAKSLSLVAVLLTAACAYTAPTAPTPVAETPRFLPIEQLSIRIAGPDTWWPDVLLFHVWAYDRNGATTRGVVRCESSLGIVEPAQWAVESRGSEVRGIRPGATITCTHGSVSASYTVSSLDWRILPGGGSPPPSPAPKPPPVTPPPAGGGS